MVRRVIVVIVAFALRRGLTTGELASALGTCFPHREPQWREDLIGDARARNWRKRERHHAAH